MNDFVYGMILFGISLPLAFYAFGLKRGLQFIGSIVLLATLYFSAYYIIGDKAKWGLIVVLVLAIFLFEKIIKKRKKK